ncbi:hypothetical protein DFS33DRAFT_1274598 [Desarmillaria ectypa]|nr:hypothetical protein DFS33DRAFT_1274598 [Desarmillaria ectypa]
MTEKVHLMTCVESLLNTGIYHLEKSIRKTAILTVDGARDLFERNHDGDPTFAQMRLRIDPGKLRVRSRCICSAFGAGDAQEEHQARNYLARKFMEAKNHAMPKIDSLLFYLVTRWLHFLVFFFFCHFIFSASSYDVLAALLIRDTRHDDEKTATTTRNNVIDADLNAVVASPIHASPLHIFRGASHIAVYQKAAEVDFEINEACIYIEI